jgi:hypothetical protein
MIDVDDEEIDATEGDVEAVKTFLIVSTAEVAAESLAAAADENDFEAIIEVGPDGEFIAGKVKREFEELLEELLHS